jgi:hypothetical protein
VDDCTRYSDVWRVSKYQFASGLEQGYVETAKTCDAYVTEGEISQVAMQQQQMPGFQGAQIATKFEVLSQQWRQLA